MSNDKDIMFTAFEKLIDSQELKKDKGKLRMDIVPPQWFVTDSAVLTFGLSKGYEEDSWRTVEPKRYKAALLRHLFAYLNGEINDPESGQPHLAHVRVNAGFLMELEQQLKEKSEIEKRIDSYFDGNGNTNCS